MKIFNFHLIPFYYVRNSLPMGFSDPVAVFFTETLISLLSGRQIQKLLSDNLLALPLSSDSRECPQVSIASALAGHENACRVLRAAVRATKRATDLESIMSALQLPGSNGKPGLEVALTANQHYLLIALAEACRRSTGSSAERIQATCEKVCILNIISLVCLSPAMYIVNF